MIERGNLRITEEPSDLLERVALILEITEGEAVAQPVKDFAESGALLSETPRKWELCSLFGVLIADGERAYDPCAYHGPSAARLVRDHERG